MSDTSGNRPGGRSHRVRLATRLPTALPGIAFTASGRAWIRQDRVSRTERLTPQKGRAAVLAEIYQQAGTATTTFPPEAAFPAQQKLTTLFDEWQDVPSYVGLRFRASFTLCLAPADSARATQFDEARRAARLQDTIMEDRMAFLRKVALRDESSALLWWLNHNIEGPDPMTSWELFDSRVRPLTLGRDPGSDIAAGVIRVAEALISQLSGDATRLANFLGIAAHIVRTSGYEDLAAELANLAAQAHPPPPRSLPPWPLAQGTAAVEALAERVQLASSKPSHRWLSIRTTFHRHVEAPGVELVRSGAPCQGFSFAGKWTIPPRAHLRCRPALHILAVVKAGGYRTAEDPCRSGHAALLRREPTPQP